MEKRETKGEYGKEDNLFTRQRNDCPVEVETKASRKRLAKKLKQLTSGRNRASSFTDRGRIMCIGIEIKEAERSETKMLDTGQKRVRYKATASYFKRKLRCCPAIIFTAGQ